jgi:N4-gp56 family major capsid protein
MAATTISTTAAQAVKQWSKMLTHETISRTWLKKFMGSSTNSIIQMHKDLSADRGDVVKIDLLRQLATYGVVGDTALKGAEEALVFVQMNVTVDQVRQGVLYQSMSQQRTVHDFRMMARDALADWFARIMDEAMFALLAGTVGGNTALGTFLTNFGGASAMIARIPDAAHIVDGTGAGVANFDLEHITMLREKAKVPTSTFYRIPPIRTEDGEDIYVIVLHPYQVTSLKTKTGTVKWQEIMASAADRGSKNPIFTGAIGMYDGCVLHESAYVPRGVPTETGWAAALAGETADTTFAMLLGAQAGHIAFGNPYSKLGGMRDYGPVNELFTYVEDVDDYGNSRGVGGASIFGIDRGQYSTDGSGGGAGAITHGLIVFPTLSPPAVA